MIERDAIDIPLDRRHPPISTLLVRFTLNIDALRDMLNDSVPQLQLIDENSIQPEVLFAIHELPEDRQADFRQYVQEQFESAIAKHPDIDAPDEIIAETSAEAANQLSRPQAREARSDVNSASRVVEQHTLEVPFEVGRLAAILGGDDQHDAAKIYKQIQAAANAPQRVTIIHNSLLTMAIGALEVLIAGIASRHFVLHPEALNSDEKSFSYADLARFESMDDAADELVSRKVGSLMRGSFQDWSAWFKEKFEADFKSLCPHFDTLVEAFQRRHVVVHNGGLVSRQYIAAVPESAEKPPLGSRLLIDRDYLNGVFDQIDALGTALAVSAWGSWVKDERDQAAGSLLNRTYELMKRERWRTALHLSEVAGSFDASEDIGESIKCNGWYCRAKLDGYESIQTEVERWDTSAKSAIYRLVRLVFLGRDDDALPMMAELVARDELTPGQASEWPVFERLRELQDFPTVLDDASRKRSAMISARDT